MINKINLKINGMHCRSCKTIIETEIKDLSGIKNIQVNHETGEANIEFENEKTSIDKIKNRITDLGYSIDKKNKEKISTKKRYINKIILFIGIIGLITGYFFISNSGAFEVLSKLNEGNVSLGLIFIIGILAGFHCVGMCGGIIVAYTSSNLKNKNKSLPPHFQYNLGRIISYTIIGGILGGIGSFFGINPVFTGSVIIIASIFMIIMGFSFMFGWRLLKKLQVRTPEPIAKYIFKQKNSENQKAPIVVGLLTGFMPCGPLQAIQLYALTTGSFIGGASAMLLYALGTVPILFIFGFLLNQIKNMPIKKIMKFSGAIIVILGIVMTNRGLASFGITPLSTTNQNLSETNKSLNENLQVVNMELNYLGYEPNVLYIKPLIPVKWVINVKQMSGCTDAIMIESLGIKKDLSLGENIIEFTPPKNAKEIKFSCWMRMVWGKFIITDNQAKASGLDTNKKIISSPQSSSCNGSCGSTTCGAAKSSGCGCGG